VAALYVLLPFWAVAAVFGMLSEPLSGEEWEVFPIAMSGLWMILSILVIPVEAILWFRKRARTDTRGFAPIIEERDTTQHA
jgi:hypothetical protein